MADFARDLGYLDKFFDTLDAHAESLTPAAKARLKVLVGEERQRWQEIRGLIGAPGGPAPAASARAPSSVAAERPASPATAPAAPSNRRAGGLRRLTVGSLIERPAR